MRDFSFVELQTTDASDIAPEMLEIYKDGANYCSFNKSAMWLIRHFEHFPFLIECNTSVHTRQIRVTYSEEVFQRLKEQYRLTSCSAETNPPVWYLSTTQSPISDYELKLWGSILFLELKYQCGMKFVKYAGSE